MASRTNPRCCCEGQIISIDSGLILDGWQSDSAFTVGVGTVSPQLSA